MCWVIVGEEVMRRSRRAAERRLRVAVDGARVEVRADIVGCCGGDYTLQ